MPTESDIPQMQHGLAKALVAGGAIALLVGFGSGHPAWGEAFALGCLASFVYYQLLGRQVTKTLAVGREPAIVQVVLSMLGRQAVCALACLASLQLWGQAWWACLAALFIARHWVMVVAPRHAAIPTAA